MQLKSLNKNNKIFIIITFIILFLCILSNHSFAATYTYTQPSNSLPENFETTYPGYLTLLQNITTEHPSWTFLLYETGLEWDTVITSEYCSVHGHGTKLAQIGSSRSGDWLCKECYKAGKTYDTGYWYCAAEPAIAYMMDPRNNLNSTDAFQFLSLSNDASITKEQIASAVTNIAYLNNDSIITAIYTVAQELNINPFYIIAKIKQEQGSGNSALCSGNGYNGYYAGYYNLFNIGATGNSESDVILNGLSYAYNKGWNTPEKAIKGGLGTTITYYINRGQNTPYYQDFNVVTQSYYCNQYATNVQDAWGVGNNIKNHYTNASLLNQNLTFIIPLYNNMPKNAEIRPFTQTQIDEKVASSTDYVTVNVTDTLALRYRKSKNSSKIMDVTGGTTVTRLVKAEEKSNDGYYWDYIILSDGTTGYMARENAEGTKIYLIKPVKHEFSETNLIITPGVTISDIEGATLKGEIFGTGAQIMLNKQTYTLVTLGDVNGDGKVTPSDYVKIKNHIMKTSTLTDAYLKAADINGDGAITPADYVKVKNHIMSVSIITL